MTSQSAIGNRQLAMTNYTLAFGFFLALLAHAYIGLFSRYWYDDFCTAAVLNDQGYVDAQKFWYINWSGRFSFHSLVSAAELIGPRIVSFLPALALLLWAAATCWALYQVFLAVRLPRAGRHSIVMGLGVIFLTIHSTPDVAQSLYWQTGMLTYLAPLTFLTTYIGIFVFVLRQRPQQLVRGNLLVLGAGLTFFAGGLSETYSLLQIAVLSILFLACMIRFSQPFTHAAVWFVMSGLCGGILAFAIVASAPGNKQRLAKFAPRPPAASSVKSSASYTLYFVERHTRRSRGGAFLSLILPAWLVLSVRGSKSDNNGPAFGIQLRSGRALKLIAFSSLSAFLLLAVCFLPVYVVSAEGLPLRAQIVPQFVLVVFMILSGFLLALAIANALHPDQQHNAVSVMVMPPSVVVIMIMIVIPVHDAQRTFALGRTASTYATRWDELEREIRQARQQGATEFVLPKTNPTNWNLGFTRIDMQPGVDATDGPNRCLAQYYHLNSVRVE